MNWKEKSVIITGGAGFIGSHLAEHLVKLGANVTVVDLFSKTGARNLDNFKNKIKMVECDVSNADDLKNLNGSIDFLFHLAALAYPKACEEDPELAFKINVQGTFNILNFALKNGTKKIVFPSSAQLYGKYPKYLPVDEKHPVDVSESVYNLTKRMGEELCNLFYEKHGLPVIYFRLFNSFGPRQAPEYFIPTVLLQAIKNSRVELWNDKPTRDFMFVEDTVKALIKGAEVSYCGGPINIGSGREVNIGDIARQISSSFNAELKFLNREVWGAMKMCCDNSKAQKILNWKPEIVFEEGLNRTIEWYKENKHLF